MITKEPHQLRSEYQGDSNILVLRHNFGTEVKYFFTSGSIDQLMEGFRMIKFPLGTFDFVIAYGGTNSDAESIIRDEINLANERKVKSLDYESLDSKLLAKPCVMKSPIKHSSVSVVRVESPAPSKSMVVNQ